MNETVSGHYSVRLANVFASIRKCGFSQREELNIFDPESRYQHSDMDIWRVSLYYLLDTERELAEKRVLLMHAICAELEDMLPDDDAAQRRFLELQQPALNGKSPKELMVSGEIRKQELVLAFLRSRE